MIFEAIILSPSRHLPKHRTVPRQAPNLLLQLVSHAALCSIGPALHLSPQASWRVELDDQDRVLGDCIQLLIANDACCDQCPRIILEISCT